MKSNKPYKISKYIDGSGQILGPKAKKMKKIDPSSNLFFLGDARDEESVGTPDFSDGHYWNRLFSLVTRAGFNVDTQIVIYWAESIVIFLK